MAAKVVPLPPKPKRSFILRVPPNSKLGQDLLRDATGGPKTIHQLVLEHFLTLLPKSGLAQPSGKAKDTVATKNVNSGDQSRVKLPREGAQQPQDRVPPLCLGAESEGLAVFEDLNVFHAQEECVSLESALQPAAEKEDDVGEMVLLVGNDSHPEDEENRKEPVENEEHREKLPDCDEMDYTAASEPPANCSKAEKQTTSVGKERKVRNLSVTIENDSPLEELSKYVDISIVAFTRNRRTRRWHSCPLCGKQFNGSSYLISHQRTHTGEKPYGCSHCGKSFNHKTNLNKHERIHTGEKPYSCSQCGKNFRQNSHRSRHEGIHVREKIFKCPECGKTFPQNEDFVLHLQSHKAERPYSCRKCGRRFRRLSNCTRHEKIHSVCKSRKQKWNRERSDGPAST